MAIIRDSPEEPGIEAWIEVNGQKLHEHDDPGVNEGDIDLEVLNSATKYTNPVAVDVKGILHTVKYIEVTSGQEFFIRFKKPSSFNLHCHHLGIKYIVDGVTTCMIHEPVLSWKTRGEEWKDSLTSLRTGSQSKGWLANCWKFGELKMIEANQSSCSKLDADMYKAKHLGALRILIYQMCAAEVWTSNDDIRTTPPEHLHDISEKAVKGRALTHTVQYRSMPIQGYDVRRPSDIFRDPLKRPFAVFEFRYRSKEGLIREGILPRPNLIDTMDDAEVRRYALELYHREGEREESTKSEAREEYIKQENEDFSVGFHKRPASDNEHPPAERYKENRRDDGNEQVNLTD